MAYVKILYQDSPSTATPLNAQNLNHMDDQIALNDQRLSELEGAHVSSFNGRTGAVTPADGDYDIGQIAPLTGAQVGQVPVVTNIGTEEDPELVFRMGAGGGAGGHEIIASDGTQMPQEPSLFLKDIHTSDDSVHLRTELEMIKNIVKADLANVTEDGMYQTTDEEDVPIGDIEEDSVSVTADGIKTWATLLNELYTKIDFSKVTDNSLFVYDTGTNRVIYTIYLKSSSLNFALSRVNNSNISNGTVNLISNNSRIFESTTTTSGTTITNNSSEKPTNGTVITLYYGTSSTIINLKTDARDCMMSDGVTSVEKILVNIGDGRLAIKYLTNTDLNTVAESGFYEIVGSTNTNMPNSNSAYSLMLVMGNGNGTTFDLCSQLVIQRTGVMFVRIFFSGAWTTWRQI